MNGCMRLAVQSLCAAAGLVIGLGLYKYSESVTVRVTGIQLEVTIKCQPECGVQVFQQQSKYPGRQKHLV